MKRSKLGHLPTWSLWLANGSRAIQARPLRAAPGVWREAELEQEQNPVVQLAARLPVL